MFNNCYRPGCHYDMNRCNCPRCRENKKVKDFDKEEDFQKENDCCFPIDICFSVKEGRKYFDRNDRNFEEKEYNYDYENDNDYNEDDYQDNYGYNENNYQKDNNFDDRKNNDNKKCKHQCCFPIDICFSVKEGKKCDKREDKHDNKKNNCNQNQWKDDRYSWKRPCHNRNNNCCLGFLAGCLFGCRKF